VAQIEFADALRPETPELPTLHDMPGADMGRLLDRLEMLESWVTMVRADAMARLERGEEIPGWARAPKRATRSWVDEKAAAEAIAQGWGVPIADLYVTPDPVLKSPAQMEKLVKGKKIPPELVQQISSGYNVVRSDNPAALPPAAVDTFDAVR
jgi:hypothetical protein